MGLTNNNLHMRQHESDELAHYAKDGCGTFDIEYKFPFGWGELWGIASRTDFDLRQHMEHSNEDFTYHDQETGEKFIPYCIGPSLGLDRVTLAFLCDAYEEEELDNGEKRTVLRFHPQLAPFKAAVLPLSKKLSGDAIKVFEKIAGDFNVEFDESQSIGKRYRRQDEIGTPYCITFDFDSLEDNKVTVRDRDTMEQTRVAIDELNDFLKEKFKY